MASAHARRAAERRAQSAYRDAQPWAQAVCVLVGALLLWGLVGMVWTVRDGLEGTVRDVGMDPLGWAWVALFLAASVAVAAWLARTHRNVETLSGSPLTIGPGWTAGTWFIPFVGGLLASLALRRLWSRGPGGSRLRPIVWAVGWSLWQVCMVGVVLFIHEAAGREAALRRLPYEAVADVRDELYTRHWELVFATELVYVLVGSFLLMTVVALQSWQRAEARRRGW